MRTFDPHKNTTEVRGANRRTDNLRVLLFGTVAIVVLFAVIYLFYMGGQTPPATV